jgi:hypothetical protein
MERIMETKKARYRIEDGVIDSCYYIDEIDSCGEQIKEVGRVKRRVDFICSDRGIMINEKTKEIKKIIQQYEMRYNSSAFFLFFT